MLLTGIGIVLALLFALGVYSARALSGVSRAGMSITSEYFRQSEQLERVDSLLSVSTGAVRDYLLESDPLALPAHRKLARESWSRAMKAIEDYRAVATSERTPLIDRLSEQAAQYWSIAEQSLDLTGAQRSETGGRLVIGELVPLREQFLATAGEIGDHDRADLRTAAGRTAGFVRGAERRMRLVMALTIVLALLVVGMTVHYVMRLEKTAVAQYAASVKMGADMERLSCRLLTLQEDERRSIARELHDDYGQRMAGLLFELSAAGERAAGVPEVTSALSGIEQRLRDVARDIQQLSRSLHSAVLDKIGLEAAIRSECNSLRQRCAWEIDFRSGDVPKRLPETLSLAAFRVFQEAVQNAWKHSRANRVEVQLKRDRGDLVLRVSDSGQGFDMAAADRNGGLGLVSMRERLRMVGGTLSIRSEVGGGTEVDARIPLPDTGPVRP